MGLVSKLVDFFKTPFKTEFAKSRSKKWISYFNRDLATNETIFSAIEMRSGAIASAPVGLYQDGLKFKPKDSNLAYLFKFGPNPRTTMFDFMKLMEVNRCSKGVAYAILEYDKYGDVESIWPLSPDFIEPMVEKDSNELYYCVKVNGGPFYIHESNMIALPFMKTGETTFIKPLDVLKDSIKFDNRVKEFSINQMNNALDINYVFKLNDVKLSNDNKHKYDDMLQQFFDEGIAIVDAGSEVAQLANKSYLDANIGTIDTITIERVERVFNLVGKLTKGSTKNTGSVDTEDLIYLKDSILPNVRQYEQEFTKKLVRYEDKLNDTEVKLSMQGFARAQMSIRGQFYQIMFRNGQLCQNEIRALEDFPSIKDGDKFYLSRDLCPMELYSDFMKSTINNQNKNSNQKAGES